MPKRVALPLQKQEAPASSGRIRSLQCADRFETAENSDDTSYWPALGIASMCEPVPTAEPQDSAAPAARRYFNGILPYVEATSSQREITTRVLQFSE